MILNPCSQWLAKSDATEWHYCYYYYYCCCYCYFYYCVISKQKLRFLAHQISWVSEWVTE